MTNAKTRKHIPKAAALKLRPGTFVRIMWEDERDEIVMLLEKPNREYGSLHYMKSDGTLDTHADYRQIVSVAGKIEWDSEHEPESEEQEEIFNAYVHVDNEYSESTTLALVGLSP